MTGSEGTSSRGRRGHALAALVAVCALTALALVPGTAAASPISCKGHWGALSGDLKADVDSDNAIGIAFACSQNVRGFTVVTNRDIDVFGVQAMSFAPQDHAPGVLTSCEGDIPGRGISCAADNAKDLIKAGYFVRSGIGFDVSPCVYDRSSAGALTASLIVSSANGQTFGPFPLKAPKGCTKKYRRSEAAATKKAAKSR
ncbi:MAG TPA: hypothetical protein VF752_00075 [Thermoleophilaceae bacterium]